jgi:uncharacterized protein YjbI with pentapeptide repeats
MAEEKSFFDDLNVKIEKYRPTDEDIKDYMLTQHTALTSAPTGSLTLNQYLKEKYFADSNVIVTADLSNRNFNRDNITDLSKGDFTGCIFKNTAFKGCNLADAVFCDVDFDNAYFEDTILKNIDFRGADLADCRFSDDYKGYSQIGKESDIEGIKFSTTSSLGRKYADIKSDLIRKQEQQDLISSKTKELADAYAKLSYIEKAWVIGKRATGNQQYDRLNEELKLMVEKKIFPRKNSSMHESFKNIFSSEMCTFDPAYIRGSTKEQRNQEVQYVPLDRKDIEKYLEERKIDKDLSLNDFAKSKLDQSEIRVGTRIVADCSSKVDISTNNEWHNRVDLSGLDFSEANLQGVIFAGSVLSGCKFNGTDVSETNFEGAEIDCTNFVGVKADNSNFFNSNLSKATISDNSQFTHTFMAQSNGMEVEVSDSNFDYANIKKGKWDKATLTKSTFNYANLEGISLISADLRKVQMQHAILDKAILKQCEIIASDLTNASLASAKAQHAKFKDTVLENIQAKFLDLSDAELSNLTKLGGADLENAILQRVNAAGVSFIKANLSSVNAQEANFCQAILDDVNMKHANLEKAILTEARAHGINLSYSALEQIKAKKVGLSNAILRRVVAEQADFTEAVFTHADLTKAKLSQAILEKVQAEKVRLEGANLTNANLANANLSGATIDSNTNIVGANLTNLQGIFFQNGKAVVPDNLQAEQAKIVQPESRSNWHYWGNILWDIRNALPPMKSVPKSIKSVYHIYNNVQELAKVSDQLLRGHLLVDEKQKLQKQQVHYLSNTIEQVGLALDGYNPKLNIDQLALIKTTIRDNLIPMIRGFVGPVAWTPVRNVARKNYDLFQGQNPKFFTDSAELGVKLAQAMLVGESNKNVQEICKHFITPVEDSGRQITDNVLKILVEPEVIKVIKEDLTSFLRDNVNQPEMIRIVENFFDDKVTRFVSSEFFHTTMSLAMNATSNVLESTPEIVGLYDSYRRHQDLSLESLTNDKLISDQQQAIKETQKEMVRSMLNSLDQVGKHLTPTLALDIPKYFADNKENILGFLSHEEVQRNIKSYGMNPKFVRDATEATIPFIIDALPVITEFTESCLKDKYGLGQIIEHISDVMNTPEYDKAKKVNKLVDSLIKFSKNNPEVQEIWQKKIPALLVKHAENLGPVVERFVNETEIGKKIKLKGEAIIKEVLGKHPKEVGTIIAAYEKKNYKGMVLPIIKLLSDKNVLALAVTAGVNFLQYNFQKYLVPNMMRSKGIGPQMNEIMQGVIENAQDLSADKGSKKDLAAILHEKAFEYAQGKAVNYSAMLDYSLDNRDFRVLSFEKTDMKLDNFEIKGFNFNKVTLGKCSFKDALLKECSFKGATFKEYINFEGATIDGSTLTTLLPEIQKYNKKHPEKTMNLDKIKVIGHIKEEVKSNPLLKNADLTKVTVKKIEVVPPVSVPKPGQTILIEQSKRKHSGTLAK